MSSTASAPVRFFAEQARIRAQTWRVTAVAVVLAAGLGVLASAGVAPLVLIVTALVIRIADLVSGGALEALRTGLSHFFGAAFADLDALITPAQSVSDVLAPQRLATLWRFGILILPGVGVTLLGYVWLLRRVSIHSDDALALALHARPARRGTDGEGETLRIAEELSIAAGIASPQLIVVEHDEPNLAIMGKDYTSWTLLMTSGFGQSLDRHEKRGAIACAVARITDGDLDVNAAVSALGSMTGLISTALDAPVSASARSRLRYVLPRLFRARGEEAAIEQRLQRATDDRMSEIHRIDIESLPMIYKVRGYLLAPFHVISFGFTMLSSLWSGLLVAGVIGFMVRRRCFKSDAAAARLLGDADMVAKGVAALASQGGVPAAGKFWRPFFIVPGVLLIKHASSEPNTDENGIGRSFFPSGQARLKRLQKLGSTVASGSEQPKTKPLWLYGVMALVGVLMAIAAVLFAFLLVVFASFFVTASVSIGYGLVLLIL